MAAELIRRERRRERTRQLIRRSAPSLRQLSRATGRNETTIRHDATDRVEQSPWYRDLEGFWLLVRGRKCDPVPMLVELQTIALEAHFGSRSTDELLRQFDVERDAENDDEANENRAGQKTDLDAYIDAHKAEAARSIRLAAIAEVLRDRGVNPLLPRTDA